MANRRSHKINGSDRHHLFYPKSEYRSKLAITFRNLPCNIVDIDYYAHRLLHTHSLKPQRPSRTDMLLAIDRHEKGVCKCHE